MMKSLIGEVRSIPHSNKINLVCKVAASVEEYDNILEAVQNDHIRDDLSHDTLYGEMFDKRMISARRNDLSRWYNIDEDNRAIVIKSMPLVIVEQALEMDDYLELSIVAVAEFTNTPSGKVAKELLENGLLFVMPRFIGTSFDMGAGRIGYPVNIQNAYDMITIDVYRVDDTGFDAEMDEEAEPETYLDPKDVEPDSIPSDAVCVDAGANGLAWAKENEGAGISANKINNKVK